MDEIKQPSQGCKATGALGWPHLHLQPRWRMSGAKPLLRLCAFMVCTGTSPRFEIKHSNVLLVTLVVTWE